VSVADEEPDPDDEAVPLVELELSLKLLLLVDDKEESFRNVTGFGLPLIWRASEMQIDCYSLLFS